MAYTTKGIAFQTVIPSNPIVSDYDNYTGTCNFENHNGVFFIKDNQKPVAQYNMYYITDDTEAKQIHVLSTRTWFKNGEIDLQRTETSTGQFIPNIMGTEKNAYRFSISGVGSSGQDDSGIYSFYAYPIFNANDTNSIIKYINNGDDSDSCVRCINIFKVFTIPC